MRVTETTATPVAQALYLDLSPDPVFATVHRPAAFGGVAVVLVAPFGWEDVCSYRSLRFWADRLAGAGHCALRISLPGTGDSGGSPRDPERFAAWTSAVAGAASWLRADTGARRLVTVGIGLGGTLAWLAAARGAPIDDLVLWGTPSRGRALLRQLRAFAELERSQIYIEAEPSAPAVGELEAGGFVITAPTAAALAAIDLTETALPAVAGRRVLLLGRDGIAVDARLLSHLGGPGDGVTVAPGPGYAEMTAHPQLATPPLDVMETVGRWLADAPALASGAAARAGEAAAPVAAHVSARITVGTGVVRETPVTIQQPFGRLSGILTEPVPGPEHRPHPLCVVLLNAGACRRIGPNRMSVEAARRWALCGVATLRLDVEGIGDADGGVNPYREDAPLYAPSLVAQVSAALQDLRARGVSERFVLGGLCSGAYWSLHTTLADPTVEAALLVNPRILVWASGLLPARDLRALLSPPYSLARIRRVATRRRVRSLALWLLGAPLRWLAERRPGAARHAGSSPDRELDALLDAILSSDRRFLFLFSANEPVDAELRRSRGDRRLTAAVGVAFARVAVRDHTLRPLWAQREAHALLDAAVMSELERARATGDPDSRDSALSQPADGSHLAA